MPHKGRVPRKLQKIMAQNSDTTNKIDSPQPCMRIQIAGYAANSGILYIFAVL